MSKNNFRIQPIIRQMIPSADQIEPIIKRDCDIVVTAGAGTGKTRTLVARYLSLITEGVPLRSIIAITFTIKAAREMRNRIREEVRRMLQFPDLSEKEAGHWRNIYENLDSARISTIHSLAAELLKQHPAEMGIDPKFELLDENQAEQLKAQAVEAALTWGSQDPVASPVFVIYGAWKLRKVIAELLSNRLDIEEVFNHASDDLWKDWEAILVQPVKHFVEDPDVILALDEILDYETNGILEQANKKGDLLVNDLRIVINSWKRIKEAYQAGNWIEISRWLGSLRAHLKQKGKKENWIPGNPRLLIKSIQPIYDENILLEEIDLDVDRKLAQEVIPGLKAIFLYANYWYGKAKEQSHGLDFDDLELLALELLNKYPHVRESWQEQIHALLVDEYQDTNHRQREIVNALNGGNRLFIVGDGKQSIYRFRGADVAVFREEQQRIGDEGCRYQLKTSYRAHPILLSNLNSLLEPVLGTDSTAAFVEPFTALVPGRKDHPWWSSKPSLELHLSAGNKSDGAGWVAAEAAAARIIEIIQQFQSDQAPGPFTFGDFAVLCRASGSFFAFESAFEKAGIPYLTIAGQGFYDRPEVRDILNAMAAFSDIQNDQAIAGFMRSPVVGIPDDILLKFRDTQEKEKERSLFETVINHSNLPAGEMDQRISDFTGMVQRYSRLAGRISAADLLNRFVEESGYIAALAMDGDFRSVQNIKKLVSDAQNSGIVGLADFLNSISELRNVAVREGEAVTVADGAVQIMTIHQAKGLEFPVVILGDASKKERSRRDILINSDFGVVLPMTETRITGLGSDQPGIRAASSLAYEIALENERLKEEAESNRLFYVAATRAQEILIINGNLGRLNKDGSLGRMGGWLEKTRDHLGLNHLGIAFEVDGQAVHTYDIRQNGLNVLVKVYESGVDFNLEGQSQDQIDRSPTGTLELPDLNFIEKRTDTRQYNKRKIYRATSDSKRATAPARVVGEVVHRALQVWKFPDQGQTDFINWTNAELISRGVILDGPLKDGYRRIKTMLERFQDHDLFSAMNTADKLYHEVPYSIGLEGIQGESGVIDALYQNNGRWFIVEFKTDEIRDKTRFDWVWEHEDYQQQVSNYIKAVEKFLGEEPQPILCFLNYQKGVHLITDRW